MSSFCLIENAFCYDITFTRAAYVMPNVRMNKRRRNVLMIPQTYAQWRHCITVECGIALTAAYIGQRLSVWRDAQSDETQRFRRLYGDQHWQAVREWFERAGREIGVA